MKNKNAFVEISFAWLFAIIVGVVILFLAIYTSTKIIKTEQTSLDARTAKEVGVLLNPLETGFETGSVNSITFPTETRVYNRCDTEDIFGRQIIQVSQKTFNKWSDTDVNVGFSNKYIYSEDFVEGKKFFVFSKPFDFPFKVTDVIYLTSSEKEYCFINAPKEIADEIEDLNQENLKIQECGAESEKICFGSSAKDDCYAIVDYGSRYVEKNGDRMYFYSNSLMYSAIFSDKEVYECQTKRVMQRAKQLSLLYKDKADFISGKNCFSNINSELTELSNLEDNFQSSENMNTHMINLVENTETKNKMSECKLW